MTQPANRNANSRRRRIAIAVGLLLLSAAAFWGLWGRAEDGSLERVRARGELRVGYAVEPPYALLKSDGTPGGESPEVAREVARRLGVRVNWVLTDFGGLLRELEAKRFDVIAAGMFITPARQKRVRFSRPTLRVRPGWLLRTGGVQGLGPYASTGVSTGLRVAVVQGSVEATLFAELGEGRSTVVVVPDARSGRQAVETGKADALALSMPTVSRMAAESAGRLIAESASGPGVRADRVGLAMRQEDESLAQAVEAALAAYVGSPDHLAMLRSLGLSEADLPEDEHVLQ